MEVVVSFMSGEAVGDLEGRGGEVASPLPLACCYYGRFRQLDAADDNSSIALGVVDEAHGSFTRCSTLIIAAGGSLVTD